MAISQTSRLYVEMSEHGLVLARVAGEGSSRKLIFWGEAPRSGKDSIANLLNAAGLADIEKPEKATLLLRPDGRAFHLSSAEEAKRLTSTEAVETFFNESPLAGYEPCEVTCVYAHGGAPVDGRSRGRWLAAGVPQETAAYALEAIGKWNIKPGRIECATFAWLGACSSLILNGSEGAPVAVCDLGPRSSSVFLVDKEGVSAHASVPIGFDQLMEIIHAELKLKFLGAANRLFFNDRYDFSKIEKIVGSKLGEILKPDLKDLVGSDRRKAASFVLTGLPARQQWVGRAIAEAVDLPLWRPDIASWVSGSTVKWNARVQPGDLDTHAIGLLQVVSDDPCEKDENRIWRARWFGQDVMDKADSSETEQLLKEAAEASARLKAPLLAQAKKSGSGADAKAGGNALKRKSGRVQLKVKPAEKSPAQPVPDTAQPQPVAAEPVTKLSAPQPAAKTAAAVSAGETAKNKADHPPAKPAKSRKSALIGAISMAAVIALMAGFGYVYFQKVEEQKRVAEQRAAAEALARQQAEEEARRVAEEKRLAEEKAAREAAEAEAAKRLAEERERKHQEELQRLLNARGAVVIVTEPEGATVKLGNLAPMTTPARFRQVHMGAYKARVELAGYDPVELDVEVTENGIFDPGVIHLRRQVGTIEVVSHPFDATFEIRPASSGFFVSSDHMKLGETPGRIGDLPPGDYVVTVLRQGWPSHTETVHLEKHETVRVEHTFVGGSVSLTSEPAGATVLVNGEIVGRTPLTLENQAPGEMVCNFELDGYVSKTVTQSVAAGETAVVNITMESEDRIVRQSELDEMPEPIETVEPAMPNAEGNRGKAVIISVTVDPEGYPRDPFIKESFDPEAARVCMEAVMQWRFKPGLIGGRPVKTRVVIPFVVR